MTRSEINPNRNQTSVDAVNACIVSIIIPTFNRKDLLVEAVASGLAQTYPHIEVVIVDDGSTDGTDKMVAARLRAEWAGKVVYLYKENGGTSSAKNAGMQKAQGAYIQFLDSDDVLRPEKVSRQMASIRSASEIVDCCVCYGRLGTLEAGWHNGMRIGEVCPNSALYIQRQCGRNVHVICTNAPLWRADFLIGFPTWREDLNVSEEWEYYIRLLSRNPLLTAVPEDLFWVREHAGDQLTKSFGNLRNARSTYRAIRTVAELLRKGPFWNSAVGQGLILRARTTYINLLRSVCTEDLREFEEWLLELARTVPSRRIVAVITMRRCIGSKAFLKLFDLYSGMRSKS